MLIISKTLFTILGLQTVWGFEIPFPLRQSKRNMVLNDDDVLERIQQTPTNIDCISMHSENGEYSFTSQGSYDVCGLYLIGEPDTVVEMEIAMDIDCELGNILAVVDGWELNGQYFPSASDHAQPLESRYIDLCYGSTRSRRFVSSQNVALVQFLVHTRGQGFTVKVNFRPNPRPCNVVAANPTGLLTMKNYGLKSNCSVSIIFPEKLYVLAVDVGLSTGSGDSTSKSGLSVQCNGSNGRADYVELLFGDGLDSDLMARKLAFCGLTTKPSRRGIVMGCQHSVVRLVSSGQFYNSISFSFQPPTAQELQRSRDIC